MHNPIGVSLPELLENFEFLDDWMERYRYIIELGKRLPEMPEAQRTAENKVLGCQSQVWLVVAESDDPERIVFEADSDAHIVRGLVAILLIPAALCFTFGALVKDRRQGLAGGRVGDQPIATPARPRRRANDAVGRRRERASRRCAPLPCRGRSRRTSPARAPTRSALRPSA